MKFILLFCLSIPGLTSTVALWGAVFYGHRAMMFQSESRKEAQIETHLDDVDRRLNETNEARKERHEENIAYKLATEGRFHELEERMRAAEQKSSNTDTGISVAFSIIIGLQTLGYLKTKEKDKRVAED